VTPVEMQFIRGEMMTLLKSILLASGAMLATAAAAQAADLPTKKMAPAPAPVSCFSSLYSYFNSTPDECPLTYAGITLYSTIDIGGGYMTHGTGFNNQWNAGVEEFVSKNGNNGRWNLAPNALSQSNVGVKVSEPLFGDLSFVGRAETGFDPYSFELSNGPGSQVDNNNRLLQNQTGNGDSARAGQPFNSQLYGGLSSKTFGTLVFGRTNSLTLDVVNAYDPMGGSYAFSPIGYSGLTAGVGDTEDTRYNTAVKYNVAAFGFRGSALAQVGGYEQGNGSNGAYEGGLGWDFHGFSADVVYSYVKDAVSLGNYPSGTSLGLGSNPAYADTLKATLSNDESVMLTAKYTWDKWKFFGGYENIHFYNPTDSYIGGFTSIGGIQVPGAMLGNASQVTSNAYIDARVQQVFWVGAKYAIWDNLDLTGAYYHYYQNNYNIPSAAACGPNTTAPAPGFSPQGSTNGKCAGTMNAVSGLIDYRPLKRVDLYAGIMYSQVTGGMASGYLHADNLAPTVGLRVRF
jgi:predicted porin